MSYTVTCRIKPYIQPFERKLALMELEALAGSAPKPVDIDGQQGSFRVRSQREPKSLAGRLAFWEAVCERQTLTTTQSFRESTVNVVRNGVPLEDLAASLPFKKSVPFPNRRCLRYGTHGLHEYRGKFFPQLVRALINIADVPEGGVVADPFCGSGTAAVETILAKRKAIGLDMNPLSVFMAQTKCDLLRLRFEELEQAYTKIRSMLLQEQKKAINISWLSDFSPADIEYLRGWFDEAVLEELDQIATCITAQTKGTTRNFMLLCLSNVLRRVSWQKEDDLRVRRELKVADDIDPVKEFLEEAGRSVRLVLAFLRQEGRPVKTSDEILEGDSRRIHHHWSKWIEKVDVVITSPPYATALPYLDTDRLSLCFLKLLPRSEHRSRDQDMIGNREISDKSRKAFWQEFTAESHSLPVSVKELISQIYDLNHKTDVGFRRRNLPPLLYKYFSDMRQVFIGMHQVLKPRASAFVVVGNNHTIAGGRRVEIGTVDLLSDIAKTTGFELVGKIEMEMLLSRDIFRNNAIESESILHFRKKR